MPPTAIKPFDPLEHINRDGYRFNTRLDNAVIKPVATAYSKIFPHPVRQGISNVFDNLDQPIVIVNDVLQGHVQWFLSDTWRFLINSTAGVLGIFDVAKHIGLPPHDNDFALTLNTYHVFTPFLMVPVLGPRTVGSAAGTLTDYYFGLRRYVVPEQYEIEVLAFYGLNTRASILGLEQHTTGLMLDPYIFMRNAYLQQRAYQLRVNAEGPPVPAWASNTQTNDSEWVE